MGAMQGVGVALAFVSDSPVTPLDPWGSVRAAMWHHNTGHRMTSKAAFAAHSRGGWRAVHRDDDGVLVPGASATFAVWDVATARRMLLPVLRIPWDAYAKGAEPIAWMLGPSVVALAVPLRAEKAGEGEGGPQRRQRAGLQCLPARKAVAAAPWTAEQGEHRPSLRGEQR